MDFETECSVDESVKDNEEISNDSTKFANFAEKSEVQKNGSYLVKSNDYGESFNKVKQNQAVVTEHAHSPSIDPTRKGRGLKKWRRIMRDMQKASSSIVITQKNSEISSNKRAQCAEPNQRSQGSVSSTNAVVRTFDGSHHPSADLGFGPRPHFGTWVDSDNSEDRSSRSSTAASGPRVKHEMPIHFELPRHRCGQGQAKAGGRSSGGRVKIEKENSRSSLESDSRSSNFLFVQGTPSLSNWIRDDNGDNMAGGEEEPGGGDGGGGCEAVVADSSSEIKGERSVNHGSPSDQDSLHVSLFELESAQEALKKELLKLKEMGDDIDSAHDCVSESGMEFMDNKKNMSFPSIQSEDLQTRSRDVETQVEDLFMQKIESEVEYMAISKTMQNLRVAAVDRVTVLEQKALASEKTPMLDKFDVIKKEAEQLESICQDIVRADEVRKLQNGVCKYSLYFLVQLVFLLVMLVAFLSLLSPSLVEIAPT